jgi:hypothetical protein
MIFFLTKRPNKKMKILMFCSENLILTIKFKKSKINNLIQN